MMFQRKYMPRLFDDNSLIERPRKINTTRKLHVVYADIFGSLESGSYHVRSVVRIVRIPSFHKGVVALSCVNFQTFFTA